MAEKLNRAQAPVTVLVPERGVSMLDAEGQPFYDPQADFALFDELEQRLKLDGLRRLIRLPLHINDPDFAQALVDAFQTLMRARTS